MNSNRRGMLLASETLKIILSVISLGLLAFLLFSLYYSGVQNKNEKAAEATLEQASQILSSLPGEIYQITPAGWYFFGFVGEEKKPNQCIGGNCLSMFISNAFKAFSTDCWQSKHKSS